MERRSFERVDSCLPVKYVCGSMIYSGTVKNLSENGMLIGTGNFLPCNDKIEILVPLDEGISRFHVRIRRIEKIDDANYNMGVEFIYSPGNYLKFVEKHKLPAAL